MDIVKRIFIIIISVCFAFFNIYKCSFVAYAYNDRIYGKTLYSDYELARKKDEINDFISGLLDDIIASGSFVASSLGAIVHGYDFEQFLKNYDAYKEYIITGNLEKDIVVLEDNSVSISSDLMSIIKQALQEYSEETNGFWLVSTTSMRALQPQYFQYKESYISIQNLINTYGIISLHMQAQYRPSIVNNVLNYGYGSFIAADFSPYVEPGYDLVCFGNYNLSTATSSMAVNIYDDSWSKISINDKYQFNAGDGKIYNDISSGNLVTGRKPFSSFYIDYPKYNNGYLYGNASIYTSDFGVGMLISKDGCRLRVFKSLTALKVYDAGQRTVYFGSDFYDKEPSEITISIDDLEKYISTDFDKYFGELQDTIISQGTNLSEQDIEKLTDSLLGKLSGIDDSIGNVGDSVKETNNLLSLILDKLESLDNNVSSILNNLDDKVTSTLDFSGIEERLDSIIMSLGIISGQLDDITAEEFESKTDDALKEMQDEFSDIGELAKNKFPLSLPWDIFGLLKMMGGGASGGGESAPETVSLLLENESDTFVHTMSLYNDNGIVLFDDDSDVSHGGGGHSRPGISSDSLHGGGGHSRWGAWLSDTGAPIFYIPVEFSHSMEIGGLLIIDLSGFEILHNIGRIMFTVIFCMNLIHLTFKAVAAGRDVLTW